MITRSVVLGTLVLAMLALAGCGSHNNDNPPGPAPSGGGTGDTPTGETPPPPPPRPQHNRATVLLMRTHYAKATASRRALIAGDIETARTNMAWLAGNDPSAGELPAELRPHLADMRGAASAFAGAHTFTEAGAAFSAMLTHCGECHVASHKGPQFPDTAPPEGDALRDRMHKHAWAADRLWEGLVMQDQSRYDSGARFLSTVTVRATELPLGDATPERVQAVADNVHTLAAEGLAATDWNGRAHAYGGLLATCAACHRLMGTGDRVATVLAQQAAQEAGGAEGADTTGGGGGGGGGGANAPPSPPSGAPPANP